MEKITKKKKKSRKKKEVEQENYDILQLDDRIKKLIIDESKNVDKYKSRIEEIIKILENEHPDYHQRKLYIQEKENLIQKISDIETNNMFAEYVCFSQKIVLEYMKLLAVPVNISFSGKKKDNTQDTKKNELLDKFLDIAKKYIPVKPHKKEQKKKVTCDCGNTTSFEYTENTITCELCGLEEKIYTIQTNFKDIDRVNLSQKYKYSKRVYFRDTINRYEGKQNKTINPKVYCDIENWFQRHNLLKLEPCEKNSETWNARHVGITKDHLYMALSETGNNLHYEDINLLYSYFTGKSCPDISHIRDKVIEDFDKVMVVYDSLEVDRVNSLNSQYILYQLLKKHKVKVHVGDFGMLKTRERLIEYDEIYSKICEKLEFSFFPTV